MASVALALTAGFGLGGGLFAIRSAGASADVWWTAAGQAHGHVQLFGWAGLTVLGVALHFLPRLRGANLAGPRLAWPALTLLLTGLVLRAVAQPLLALVGEAARGAVGTAVVLSGAFELGGGLLVVGMLAATLRRPAPGHKGTALRPVLPLFAGGFAGLWLALVANLIGVVRAAWSGAGLVPSTWDGATVDLALFAFLVPIAAAMSARTFPLYFQTRPAPPLLLWTGWAATQLGLVLWLAGSAALRAWALGCGEILLAAGLLSLSLAVGIFGARRPLPRRPVRLRVDPLQLHALSAWGWAVLAALLLALSGAGKLGAEVTAPSVDSVRHALGAGFVTLLILGVGGHLLPGFSRRPLASRRLTWATLVTGNLAALLRVVPVLADGARPGGVPAALLALAGVFGLAAIALFALNIWGPIGRRRAAEP
ncbi:MAG TPA: hypothetical protein VMU89_16970 [Thermomicrobiaceae bacterium]|nr:hypothetical protein [Thermomicrobiaceae bacterium]